ncbi:uncharacterized protein AKAW2_11560A [Aspergillus luchuensis]|uniref:Uncharacterized protein n=1 Tax=Aspergillus kawachii TaxID=1069201 RepID=A0A146F195_ASPKA|nr:uncharacterized protein AKAW2_11560A [Aspergillus luchuensis]BCR94514.1 hypothetical protein AKAW2_11560A [Aspergillus luchuensis]GAA85351.1 hypothetical protein AKAW_03465 [Aspergillus luchuensis IFO 4308]GAT19996.1 hypothetical protein RIB2604_00605800 [Aspergillus luchuensis]
MAQSAIPATLYHPLQLIVGFPGPADTAAFFESPSPYMECVPQTPTPDDAMLAAEFRSITTLFPYTTPTAHSAMPSQFPPRTLAHNPSVCSSAA